MYYNKILMSCLSDKHQFLFNVIELNVETPELFKLLFMLVEFSIAFKLTCNIPLILLEFKIAKLETFNDDTNVRLL